MPTGKETVALLENQYAKILAIVIRKHRLNVVINSQDINDALVGGANLIVQELEDGLHIRVVGDKEAARLQALENKLNPPKK